MVKNDLVEGNWYKFEIIKLIELPSEKQKNYILKDDNNKRYLLPVEYYVNYGFKIGDFITCRLDKINCVGQYYLEPKHPVYNEGEVFDFYLEEIDEKRNENGDLVGHYIVRDIFNNQIGFSCNEFFVPGKVGDKISCRVEKVRKGKLILNFPEQKKEYLGLQPGDDYLFTVIHPETKNSYNKDYVLEDKNGRKYSLSWDYYKHYNIIVGQKLKCNVRLSSSKGDYVLEPENPYYKIDKTYYFEILRIEALTDYFINKSTVLILKDVFGNEIKLLDTEQTYSSKFCGKFLSCKVTGFKNGRIYVKNMGLVSDKAL